jgi:heme exporter protein C
MPRAGVVLGVLVLFQWVLALCWVPVDQLQGDVYRIIYLHVPSAFAAFLAAGILLVTSILNLKNPSATKYVHTSRAAVEVGLMFTILTLASGSIWGKPTWGTWWTWDARLTTTLLLGLLYGGWILLHNSLPVGAARNRACAILGILIAADVPIIYKSVTWWRTLHQPQTIMRPGGSATMDPDMLKVLIAGMVLMILVCGWLTRERQKNLVLESDLTEKSLKGVL